MRSPDRKGKDQSPSLLHSHIILVLSLSLLNLRRKLMSSSGLWREYQPVLCIHLYLPARIYQWKVPALVPQRKQIKVMR